MYLKHKAKKVTKKSKIVKLKGFKPNVFGCLPSSGLMMANSASGVAVEFGVCECGAFDSLLPDKRFQCSLLRVVSLVALEGLVNGFQIFKTWPINQFHYFISWYSPKPNIWSPW